VNGDSKSAAAGDDTPPPAAASLIRQSTNDSIPDPDGLTRQTSAASGDGDWGDLEVDDSALGGGGSSSALAVAKAAGQIGTGAAGSAVASGSILASTLLKEPVKLKIQYARACTLFVLN
jgi:hypothetical protein